MPEGEYRPSPAEMGAEEPEESKFDKPKKAGILKRAARVGAFVAAGLVGGGVAGSGTVEAAAGQGRQEVRQSTWHQMYEAVRTHIHEALKQGADAEKVDVYMKEALRIIAETRSKGNVPDSANVGLEQLWSATFPKGEDDFDKAKDDMSDEFDNFVGKAEVEFQDFKKDIDSTFDAAVKDQEIEFKKFVGEADSTYTTGVIEMQKDPQIASMDAMTELSNKYAATNNTQERKILREEMARTYLDEWSEKHAFVQRGKYSLTMDLLGGIKLDVKFSIDQKGNLTAHVLDKKTGETTDFSIHTPEAK